MLLGNPLADFLALLLFAIVLVWALWQGLPDIAQGLGWNPREDVQFFPDEIGDDLGSGTNAESRRKLAPRDGPRPTTVKG
jgi:hypothetical protein